MSAMDLNGKKIAILATNCFEQAELEIPRDRLKKAGAIVHVVSLTADVIKGWDKKDWGRPVKVDKTLKEVSAGDYDAIVLPGGQINPDLLRVERRRSGSSRTSSTPTKSSRPCVMHLGF
jgi:protease I